MNKKQILLYSVLIVAGGVAGYLYWNYIGCQTNSCPITSTWYKSTAVGGILGYLTGDTINNLINKNVTKKLKLKK